MRKTPVIGAVALVIPFAAVAADKAEIRAGRWEEVMTMTSLTLGGTSVPMSEIPNSSTTRKVCVSAEEASDPAKHFLSVGQDSKCTPNGMVVDGRINLIGQCTMEKFGKMLITGEGTYQLSNYQVTAKMTGELKQRPIVITMAIKGRHIGACDSAESR